MHPPSPSPPAAAPAGHGGVRRGRLARWVARWGTAVAVTTSACSSIMAVAYIDGPDAPLSNMSMLAFLVGATLAGLLVLRRKHPVALTLGASAASLLLQLDSFAALLALSWVVTTARARTAVLCGVAAGSATAVALVRDLAREPGGRVFAVHDTVTGELTSYPGPWEFLVWGVVLVAAAVGAGLLRRFRAAADDSRAAQATAVAVLQDRMTRQEERELIAREVHDTVAHHIAAISLQASAIEVTHGDPETKQAARQVRASAQHAIAEMRSLIATLRTGDETGMPGASLEDLVPLLDGLREQGHTVSGTVFVSDAEHAPTALTRATFRIVQESVTNALKHAPGAPVEVNVRAGRDHGVHVRVSNPLVPGAPTFPGTGSGVTGMVERAEALGGRLVVEPGPDRYTVTADLPWAAVPAT
ncbi:sensor histidine kinase [Xylanimonas oleitrophica]|nr:histidine kinase [Xylanimonas oleitrophica]